MNERPQPKQVLETLIHNSISRAPDTRKSGEVATLATLARDARNGQSRAVGYGLRDFQNEGEISTSHALALFLAAISSYLAGGLAEESQHGQFHEGYSPSMDDMPVIPYLAELTLEQIASDNELLVLQFPLDTTPEDLDGMNLDPVDKNIARGAITLRKTVGEILGRRNTVYGNLMAELGAPTEELRSGARFVIDGLELLAARTTEETA